MVRLSEDELAAIYAALAVNVRGYHQVVEVSLPSCEIGTWLMIALDLPSAIHWRSCTHREWTTPSTPRHSRRRFNDPISDWSISCESHDYKSQD